MPPGSNALFLVLLNRIVVLGLAARVWLCSCYYQYLYSPLLLLMFSFLYGNTNPIKSIPLFLKITPLNMD